MGPIVRGARNVFRSPIRTGAVLILLTISISMALVMVQVRGSIDSRLVEVRESVGTSIEVSQLGASQGGGEPLADAELRQLEGLDHVVAVDKVLAARYSGDALEPAIDPTSFGDHGGEPGVFGGGQAPAQRRFPISFTGVSLTSHVQLFDDSDIAIMAGRNLTTEDESKQVVLLGQTLAETNALPVGSRLQLESGPALEVVGIFSAGHRWGDNAVYMPLGTLREMMGIDDGASSATVYVDSADDLEAVVSAIEDTLGPSRVSVTSGLELAELLASPLEGLRGTSTVGTIAALAGAGGVILLAMFMLVRDRAREIGILKAIGASSRQVVAQFSTETLIVSAAAAVGGFALAVASAETVAARFFTPVSSPSSAGFFQGEHQSGGAAHAGGGGFFGDRLSGGSLGPLDISVSPDLLLYAMGGAVVLAVLGSLVAAVYIARLRPAEVLRYE